jgi:hypothetical protein
VELFWKETPNELTATLILRAADEKSILFFSSSMVYYLGARERILVNRTRFIRFLVRRLFDGIIVRSVT